LFLGYGNAPAVERGEQASVATNMPRLVEDPVGGGLVDALLPG
jgi:hypothetical protein